MLNMHEVYVWDIDNELKNGKTVYMLDCADHTVRNVAEVKYGEIAAIKHADFDAQGRYYFYTVEETEEAQA